MTPAELSALAKQVDECLKPEPLQRFRRKPQVGWLLKLEEARCALQKVVGEMHVERCLCHDVGDLWEWMNPTTKECVEEFDGPEGHHDSTTHPFVDARCQKRRDALLAAPPPLEEP